MDGSELPFVGVNVLGRLVAGSAYSELDLADRISAVGAVHATRTERQESTSQPTYLKMRAKRLLVSTDGSVYIRQTQLNTAADKVFALTRASTLRI